MPPFVALFPLKMDARVCYDFLIIKVCTLNGGGKINMFLSGCFFHSNRKGTKPGGDGTKLTIIAYNSLEMVPGWGMGSNGNRGVSVCWYTFDYGIVFWARNVGRLN